MSSARIIVMIVMALLTSEIFGGDGIVVNSNA